MKEPKQKKYCSQYVVYWDCGVCKIKHKTKERAMMCAAKEKKKNNKNKKLAKAKAKKEREYEKGLDKLIAESKANNEPPLKARAINALILYGSYEHLLKTGINTVELSQIPYKELFKVPNLGRKSVFIIRAWLESEGYTLNNNRWVLKADRLLSTLNDERIRVIELADNIDANRNAFAVLTAGHSHLVLRILFPDYNDIMQDDNEKVIILIKARLTNYKENKRYYSYKSLINGI